MKILAQVGVNLTDDENIALESRPDSYANKRLSEGKGERLTYTPKEIKALEQERRRTLTAPSEEQDVTPVDVAERERVERDAPVERRGRMFDWKTEHED